jgi:hypothetical protein
MARSLAVTTTSSPPGVTVPSDRHPKPVLVLVKDVHVRITAPNGEVLRDFQLDPTRAYQPQPKT